MDMAEEFLERPSYQGVERLVRARSAWVSRSSMAKGLLVIQVVSKIGCGHATSFTKARVAVMAQIVPVVFIMTLRAVSSATQALVGYPGPLGWSVDALDALGSTPFTGGHVA